MGSLGGAAVTLHLGPQTLVLSFGQHRIGVGDGQFRTWTLGQGDAGQGGG